MCSYEGHSKIARSVKTGTSQQVRQMTFSTSISLTPVHTHSFFFYKTASRLFAADGTDRRLRKKSKGLPIAFYERLKISGIARIIVNVSYLFL